MSVKNWNDLLTCSHLAKSWSLSWSYRRQLKRKCNSSSISLTLSPMQNQQTLWSGGSGAGRLYLPVSILREWLLILSLVIGTPKYRGSDRYGSVLKPCLISLYVRSFLDVSHKLPSQLWMYLSVRRCSSSAMNTLWSTMSGRVDTSGKPALVRVSLTNFAHWISSNLERV